VNFIVSLAVITLLFALLYKYVPDAKIAWRDVWLGALVTALLFTLGKMALGIYLGSSDAASTFGAAASIIIMLLWVYYSAQILFFGAEFTQVYANSFGSRIVPEEHAEAVTAEKRAQEGMPRRQGAPQAPAGQPGTVTGPPAPVMVPVTAVSGQPLALPPPRTITPSWQRILQASTPALLALAVGALGSLVIVREGEKSKRMESNSHG
jgi:membrane protein